MIRYNGYTVYVKVYSLPCFGNFFQFKIGRVMYDTVNMTLYQSDCPNTDFLHSVPPQIEVSNVGKNMYGEYITGSLGGKLDIRITERSVKICDNSICKYYLRDNFQTLSRGDTKRAIEQISDCLKLPFDRANLTRIDVAQNFVMRYEEKLYYPYLGELPYFNRLEQDNGLYYKNGRKTSLFYGKEYEQKVKGNLIPELYKDKNVLRYEYRLLKRLGETLNEPEVKAYMLYDEVFYSKIVRMWKENYLKIHKLKSKINAMPPTNSKKGFIENLAYMTISDIGQPQVLKKIKEWQSMNAITKKQAYDLRKGVKEISKVTFDEQGNELIQELDKKIIQTARCA